MKGVPVRRSKQHDLTESRLQRRFDAQREVWGSVQKQAYRHAADALLAMIAREADRIQRELTSEQWLANVQYVNLRGSQPKPVAQRLLDGDWPTLRVRPLFELGCVKTHRFDEDHGIHYGAGLNERHLHLGISLGGTLYSRKPKAAIWRPLALTFAHTELTAPYAKSNLVHLELLYVWLEGLRGLDLAANEVLPRNEQTGITIDSDGAIHIAASTDTASPADAQ